MLSWSNMRQCGFSEELPEDMAFSEGFAKVRHEIGGG